MIKFPEQGEKIIRVPLDYRKVIILCFYSIFYNNIQRALMTFIIRGKCFKWQNDVYIQNMWGSLSWVEILLSQFSFKDQGFPFLPSVRSPCVTRGLVEDQADTEQNIANPPAL